MIDVVIPAYIPSETHVMYLCEALESLACQTYKDFTARIILNGPDVSKKLPFDERFDYHVMNGKQSAAKARNYGIKLGTSKYVAQLDADDMYMPNKLEKQFQFLEKNADYSIVATSSLVLINGRLEKSCNDPNLVGSHEQIIAVINDINPICCGSVMFRRSDIFNDGLFYNEEYKPGSYWPTYQKSMNEDWDLWIRCVNNGKKIHTLPEELYIWRDGSRVER